MYSPREDSYLLESCIPKYAKGQILDMGTGSGILAAKAAEIANQVVAVDINKPTLEKAKKLHPEKNIQWLQSDLFEKVTGTFDLIICNPPYLPNDPQVKDITLDGGKEGYEWIIHFLEQAPNFLKKNGTILLLFSSLSKKKIIDSYLKKHNLNHETLTTKKLFFETLYIYRIWME